MGDGEQTSTGSVLGGSTAASTSSTQGSSAGASAAGTSTGGTQTSTGSASSGAGDWRSSLPEEIRGEASLTSIQDVASLAKSYVHAQKMLGGEKLSAPNKHWTDNDWNQLYNKLGRPESLDKYEMKLPDGAKFNEDSVKAFKETAYKAGLLPKQAEAVLALQHDLTQKQMQAYQAQQKQRVADGLKGLQNEWGDGYQKQVEAARIAIDQFGGEKAEDGRNDLARFMDETGLGNDPRMIKLMAKIGNSLGESKLREAGATHLGGVTPQEAQSKIMQIQSDAAHPYYNASHPSHKAAVAEMQKLFEMAHPSQAG